MDVESIAGFIGLGVAVVVLIALSVFESREYKREHSGEGRVHHWMAAHHLLNWRHRH